MPKALSSDLRERVTAVMQRGATSWEAAAQFAVSVASALRWMQRLRRTGSVSAAPSGGSQSPLEAEAAWLLALVAAEPDLTLGEIQRRLADRGRSASIGALWRFYDRHAVSFKKRPARRRAAAA
jgi:transposase